MTKSTYKLIAIDLDGTLLCPAGTVSDRVREAIHRALKAGLLVCFATGRNFTESCSILESVGHFDTAVFVGGAMVVDTKQRVTLHRTMMAPELARDVCDLLESMGQAALALQEQGHNGLDYLVTDNVELNEATRQWMTVTKATVHRHPRLGRYSHNHTIRVGIVAKPEDAARAKAAIEQRFGDRVVCHTLSVSAYGVDVLEVFDPAVNKWQGILHVAERHGILPEQIIAIGDDVNDLPMIRNAGLGVAMGNARPEIKAAARRVIGRNDEDGLAEFLEELISQHAVEPVESVSAGTAQVR
jgi:Cof subfamily protein (haloacid dehalogenase superfamily)